MLKCNTFISRIIIITCDIFMFICNLNLLLDISYAAKISRSSIWFCYTLGLLNWLLFYTWKSLIFLYCFSTVFNERSNYISCWAVNEMSDCRRNAYMFMLHRCDAFYITTYGGVCWWLTFTQLYDTGTWNTHDDKLSTHETCLKIKHWKVWENI